MLVLVSNVCSYLMNQNNCFSIRGEKLTPGIPFFSDTSWNRFCGYLVGFNTDDLDFGGAYTPRFRFSPGGEWYSLQPIWHRSNEADDALPRRLQVSKREVWALQYNFALAVGDCHNGLRFVEAEYASLKIRRPKSAEVKKYLRERAAAMAIQKWQEERERLGSIPEFLESLSKRKLSSTSRVPA